MGSLLNGLFSRRNATQAPRSRRRGAAERQVEKLENRLAMAINVYAPTTGSGSVAPWAVIASDNADDVYIQQVAGNTESLFVADNSSFLNAQGIPGVNQRITTLYATNGTDTTVTGIAPVNAGSTLTTFDLHRDGVYLGSPPPIVANSTYNPLFGSVTYAGNTWSFSTDGFSGRGLTFQLSSAGTLSDPTLVRPTSGFVADNAGADAVRIFWSAPPLAAPGAGIDVPAISVNYSVGPNNYVGDFARPSAGELPTFSLPVTGTNPGGIVPGTLTGTLTVDGYSISFRMNSLFTPLGGSAADNDLFFGNEGTGAPGLTGAVLVPDAGNGRRITVTGFVDYDSGRVFLDFSDINPGPVAISFANYATFNQDAKSSTFTVAPGQNFTREIFADQLSPGSTIDINSPILQNAFGAGTLGRNGVTLAATNVNVNAQVRSVNYFDINSDHGVFFTADRNAITATATARAIVGPAGEVTAIAVPVGGGGQGYDDDPANAPRVTFTGGGAAVNATGRGVVVNGVVVRWEVVDPGAGYTSLPTAIVDAPPSVDGAGNPWLPALVAAVPERINFNAAVAADSYIINMGDDPGTPAIDRGRLYVSSSGSLSGSLAATTAPTTASSSVRVIADTADIVVEGTVFATTQSYFLQSATTRQDLLPFSFTTRAPLTGVNSGLIRGTTVAVTLGNEMPTPEQESTAASVVDLRTQLASMRITAASPNSAPLAGPYPYDLTIAEVDDISFDAVAASSRPITVTAGGSIGFTSALATAGDLSLTAGAAFTISAPLSTARGRIDITGTSVNVTNSVRVLAPPEDSSRDDILITATAGDMSLAGALTAVNNVRLVQRNRAGTPGRLGGQTRIVARGVEVEAEGAVDIRTDAVTFAGRAGGSLSLNELDDILVTDLRSPGFVTLVAGGVDPGVDSPFSPNTVALDATLTDVVGLSVSAPRGSVRVVNNVAQSTTLGDPAAIAAGTAPSMQAAGEVIIRALATSVTVADAPVGGGSAVAVRVATSAALPTATYAQNSPGTFASTLTGARVPLVIDGVAVRVGDRVLVKNQPAGRQRENGIYVVTTSGSTGTAWRLTRASDADTSAELPAGSFIRVAEGSAAGRVFSIAYATADNVSPIAVTTVANRAGATLVRTATTGAIAGTYDAVATTITAVATGALPAIDGVALADGDLVLVRLGDRTGNAAANGVYEVTSAGGSASRWMLTRAVNLDNGQPITSGYVATTEGSYRAALTGQAFRLAYDSLGIDPLSATVADGGSGTGRPLTSIGSESIVSTTTFVVSSTAGTNDAAGSLGKMILLRNSVAPAPGSRNPGEVPGFAFAASLPGLAGAPAGVIRLTQELPAIAKAFAINGANRVALPSGGAATQQIVVDGVRIVQTKSGTAASLAAEVNGFEFTGGTDPRSIANLTVGGFPKGSAVKINGVPDVLVSGMTLGRNENGERLANQHGVRITGNAVRATVLGGTIVGSTGAGVKVDAGSTDYTVVGTTIGAVNQNNVAGVNSAGTGRIGVTPLAATFNAAIDVVLTPGGTTIQLPANVPAGAVYAGQPVSGLAGIPVGTTVVTAVGNRITISQPMTAAGTTKLTLGTPPRTVIQENLTGVALTGGTTTMINTTVQRSTFDGIVISGGVHAIGTNTTTTDGVNQITSNGQFGVRINSPAVAQAQSIVNNVFGQIGLNLLGNVGVNGAVAPASLGYVPREVTLPNRLKVNRDSKLNIHAAGGGSGSSGNTGAGRPTAVARPVTTRPYRAR